jgi:hypothetical protein
LVLFATQQAWGGRSSGDLGHGGTLQSLSRACNDRSRLNLEDGMHKQGCAHIPTSIRFTPWQIRKSTLTVPFH